MSKMKVSNVMPVGGWNPPNTTAFFLSGEVKLKSTQGGGNVPEVGCDVHIPVMCNVE